MLQAVWETAEFGRFCTDSWRWFSTNRNMQLYKVIPLCLADVFHRYIPWTLHTTRRFAKAFRWAQHEPFSWTVIACLDVSFCKNWQSNSHWKLYVSLGSPSHRNQENSHRHHEKQPARFTNTSWTSEPVRRHHKTELLHQQQWYNNSERWPRNGCPVFRHNCGNLFYNMLKLYIVHT
jgi:hypothetical protein